MSLQKLLLAAFGLTLTFLAAMGVTAFLLAKQKGESAATMNTVMDWAVEPIRDLNVIGLKAMALETDSPSDKALAALKDWQAFIDKYDKTLRLTSDPPSVALLNGKGRKDILDRETATLSVLPALLAKIKGDYESGSGPEAADIAQMRTVSADFMALNADFALIFSKDATGGLQSQDDNLVRASGLLAILMVLLQFGLFLTIRRRLFRPLVSLMSGLERISTGDLTVKVGT